MNCINYVCKCFKHYADFKGRANRCEFWSFLIFCEIITSILIILDNHVCPDSWHHGFIGLILESFSSGYSIPYLLHWYEQHPDIPEGFGIITSIWTIIIMLPCIALSVRRMHDINMSGWFVIIAYIPLIGWGWFFIYSLLRGSEEENNYGPKPVAEKCCCCKK